MKKSLLVLQFLLTLIILAFVPNNFLKVICLLPLWWITFNGLKCRECIAFCIINILFIFSDIGAIQNNFFKFSEPDFLGLPFWEFFMWGYYLLHTHRMFPPKDLKGFDFKIWVMAILFSLLFMIVPDRNILLLATAGILVTTLFFYHQKQDFLYCGYLMMLGVCIEYVGLRLNLWIYPERDYSSALLQFVVMWGASGLYFRRIMGGWLVSKSEKIKV